MSKSLWNTRRAILGTSTLLLATAPGCFGLLAAAALANAIPCDGKFLDEVQSDEGLSDECREELAPYMPDPADNFEARLILLGSERDAVGNLSLYMHGADGSGRPFELADFDSATVIVTTADGERVELAGSELSIEAKGDSAEQLVSLALVNDYSGSMLDHDLDNVEDLQLLVVDCLPPSTEASVTFFSDEVLVKQEFTEDRDRMAEAVRRDDGFERNLTALYDGMGVALDQLAERDRPVRILMVSSDGLENASVERSKYDLLDTVKAEGVTVVVLGALFADLNELEDLTQHDGVFFYTPFYDDMEAYAGDYIRSLKNMVEVSIPAAYADAQSIEIQLGDATSAEITPSGD